MMWPHVVTKALKALSVSLLDEDLDAALRVGLTTCDRRRKNPTAPRLSRVKSETWNTLGKTFGSGGSGVPAVVRTCRNGLTTNLVSPSPNQK